MRVVLALSTLTALALSPACSCSNTIPGTEPRPCASASDCRGDDICVDGMCVEPVTPGEDAGRPSGMCVDGDGDGYGEGPGCRGPDCNDGDPMQTGVEVCDGFDNDCDTVVDNGVLSSCGDCNPDCMGDAEGVGTDDPFDLEDPGTESDGVSLDPEGAIVLDSRSVDTNFIWVANTGAGQVVKIDTDTFAEVGRYVTDNDPSRTSVNTIGDVYVGNRNGTSVTKVDVRGDETCPDTNGDGVITTSMGGGHVLPAGQDDCVLWTVELAGGGIIRAVAAQDEIGPDGELRSFVWVGGWNGVIWKLDGDTGAIVLQTEAPVQPYGFALDAAGNLWSSGLTGDMGRLDTNVCRDDASCAVSVCVGETPECDAAVKQRIRLPDTGYGITVDFTQRVWIAGTTIKRYDPRAPAGARFATAAPGPFCNGIGADAMGFVYGACEGGNSIVRVDANTMAFASIPTNNNRGVGIDADGKIWGINRNNGPCANVVTPGPGLMDNPTMNNVGPALSSPYTYSDMTGLQLRLATNPRGYYRSVFEGCDPTASDGTTWGDLNWRAETPAGTTLVWRVRTADEIALLEAQEWIVVANVPPDAAPVDLAAALTGAGVEHGRYLQIEVTLTSERGSATEVVTPRVLMISAEHTCAPIFG